MKMRHLALCVIALSSLILSASPYVRAMPSSLRVRVSAPAPPSGLTVAPDENSAILQWGNPYENYFASPADEAEDPSPGYAVYWGPYDASTGGISSAEMKLTRLPIVQLQPLVSNTVYGAYVETVSVYGQVSPPSPIITFQTDPSRVAALRQEMTGFFDDFNLPQGPVDETKWNTAVSGCVAPGMGMTFINDQQHVHNMVYDGFCDRGQVVSRPRATFDFTNRVGTIVFDMDGAQRRDDWYLDLTPDTDGIIDIPGHISLDSSDPGHTGQGNSRPTPPINTLRLEMQDDAFKIFYFDYAGWEVQADGSNPYCGANVQLCNPSLGTVKNVRRDFRVQIYRDSAPDAISATVGLTVTVNGQTIDVAHALPFPTQRANMDWVLFSYNTAKSNEPDTLLHWDNFGFDGPPSPVVTHNYLDGISGTGPASSDASFQFPYASTGNPVTQAITVPDSIAGATAARLMFTVQMPNNRTFNWSPNDVVMLNDKTYPFPNPSTFPYNAGLPPDSLVAEPVVINIPPSDFDNIRLHNTVVFSLTSAGILNTHLEVDFPTGGPIPAYTPPTVISPGLLPMMPGGVGPAAVISSIGGYLDTSGAWHDGVFNAGNWSGGLSTDPTNNNVGAISHPTAAVSGAVDIWPSITNDIAMQADGQDPGITEYDIVVDRTLLHAVNTDAQVPAAEVHGVFQWDTSQLCNGVHEVFLQAYNPAADVSIPDYFQGDGQQNQYNPIFVTTSNPGQPTCAPLGPPPAQLDIPPAYPVSPTPTPPAASPSPTMTRGTPTAAATPTAIAPTATATISPRMPSPSPTLGPIATIVLASPSPTPDQSPGTRPDAAAGLLMRASTHRARTHRAQATRLRIAVHARRLKGGLVLDVVVYTAARARLAIVVDGIAQAQPPVASLGLRQSHAIAVFHLQKSGVAGSRGQFALDIPLPRILSALGLHEVLVTARVIGIHGRGGRGEVLVRLNQPQPRAI